MTSIVSLLEEAIDVFDNKLKLENVASAQIKFELGSFLHRVPAAGIGTKIARYESVEKLFTDVVRTRQRILGETHDETIVAILALANFLNYNTELEKSLILYGEVITAVEKKYGNTSKLLLPAMRSSTRIFVATEQQVQADALRVRISKITGVDEPMPSADVDISNRAKGDYLEKILNDPRTIFEGLKKQKSLLVNVLIDEKGEVTEVQAADPKEKDMFGKNVREKAEKEVRKWRFRPFVVNGAARKMRGIIWFPYLIKG